MRKKKCLQFRLQCNLRTSLVTGSGCGGRGSLFRCWCGCWAAAEMRELCGDFATDGCVVLNQSNIYTMNNMSQLPRTYIYMK